jgi:hypothetical protein
MALRFIDSFDHYQDGQIMAKWTTRSNPGFHVIQVGTGRCGTNCLAMSSGGSVSLTKGIPFSGLVGIAGFALMVENQVFASSRFLEFNCGGGSGVNIRVYRLTDGSISVERADNVPVTLGTTPPDVTRVGGWYYIEVRVVIDAVAGEVQVHVNGVEQLNLAGIDTLSAVGTLTLTAITIVASQSFIYRIDDLYVLDDSGPAPNNTFLGDVRVEYLQPTADGTHQDWSLVGAAAHWEAVDDGDTPDDDVSYIHTATVGQIDTEVYENTGLPAGTIFGLQLGLYARKTDSGFREVTPVVLHGGVVFAGTAHAPSFASYTYLIEMYNTNPGTGVAWTIPDVNNAEYGVRLAV